MKEREYQNEQKRKEIHNRNSGHEIKQVIKDQQKYTRPKSSAQDRKSS
jgi:hypothetical protein